MNIHFIWNENKNKINKRKHKVSFEEAKTVFLDDYARLIYDPGHSEREDRFLLLGMMKKLELLRQGELQERRQNNIMRKEYDFSKSVKNPYAKKLKKQISIRIEKETINYFRNVASETGIPYQNLIDLYLRDCVESHKKLKFKWA